MGLINIKSNHNCCILGTVRNLKSSSVQTEHVGTKERRTSGSVQAPHNCK
ncbi:hypothetical protein SNOG_13272 [Parastagonospora nodorum SN15]|uniref:Uncharacterized protein n=1 Tax=Phaeosphaeria nodorum (strain SN15 / ATCC MYA-4574 / FGSC 10173) TaxID=321614 RepID=Q0U4P2_PHANO|nr:hypothetical protein SNOG_13272 [Parastagonospora nodorum SN15]EAT79156.1 hypothetical protein SNOG_13272 [Parastagonospora nodorum SN15]